MLARTAMDPRLVQDAVDVFLRKSALTIEGAAKQLAPVDTGRLRSSIASEFAPWRAQVGTTVFYAPFVEFGTRPHWPPIGALTRWGRRHGIPAFLVARAIAQRGTKAQPFFRPAIERSMAAIQGFLSDAAHAIERRWAH